MTAATVARPHSHRKPSRLHRFTARWHAWRQRNTRRQIEEARTDAWLARVEHHEPGPAVAAACAVTALIEVATGPMHPPAWAEVPAADGPLPAALEAEPPADEFPHLRPGQFPWHTGELRAADLRLMLEGGPDASTP